MPSRILLISANRCTTPDPVFPLGLAHVNAALRQAGHETRWIDVLADNTGLTEALKQFKPDFVGISLRNIDDVLIRKQETFFRDLASLGEVVRREISCPIIVGGSGFSIFPDRLLELAGADYGIAGEGEAAFLALLAALEKGGSYQNIPGLVFRQGDRIVANSPTRNPPEGELSEADRPASVVAHYLQNGGMLNLQTQRGCAHRCCYCTYPVIEGRQHRRRPPEAVAAEFEQLQRLGARYAFIVDSIFNSSVRHVTEICEALLQRNVKLPWGCFLRPQG
ncbi:MAG TPA: cobalamin-dependent protein, partial [Clostridia bacterium]|nr:cobalamin-dependent protein [Clostridia bacterium]